MSDRSRETAVVLAVEKYIPTRAEKALEHFCKSNPHYQGAKWADVLDLLHQSDAHVDMTEAIYSDLRIIVPIGTEDFIIPVFYTLLYYNKGVAPFATEVAYWHGWVTANFQADEERNARAAT